MVKEVAIIGTALYIAGRFVFTRHPARYRIAIVAPSLQSLSDAKLPGVWKWQPINEGLWLGESGLIGYGYRTAMKVGPWAYKDSEGITQVLQIRKVETITKDNR